MHPSHSASASASLAWEELFLQKAKEIYPRTDPAHDFSHVLRVLEMARKICVLEGENWQVVLPAALFHDFVNVSKSDPRRKQASKLSGIAACEYLQAVNYPAELFAEIQHAIEAHSFSAGIEPKSLEAQIVQDADRLDALGAIGILRCFSIGTQLSRPFYSLQDPLAAERELNDGEFTIDHFFVKLFKISETLKTKSGQKEGALRVKKMKTFLAHLEDEITLSVQHPN